MQAQQKGPPPSKGKAPADSSTHEATLPSYNEDDLPTTLEGKKQFIAKAQADAIMAKQFEREIQEQEAGAGRRRPADIETQEQEAGTGRRRPANIEIQEQETGTGRRRPAKLEIPHIGELPSDYNAGTSTSPVRKSPGGRRGGDFGPPPSSPSRTVSLISECSLFSTDSF